MGTAAGIVVSRPFRASPLPHRLQDLADVIHLIRRNGLTPEFAAGLHPVVQEHFRELWRDAQRPDGED